MQEPNDGCKEWRIVPNRKIMKEKKDIEVYKKLLNGETSAGWSIVLDKIEIIEGNYN